MGKSTGLTRVRSQMTRYTALECDHGAAATQALLQDLYGASSMAVVG